MEVTFLPQPGDLIQNIVDVVSVSPKILVRIVELSVLLQVSLGDGTCVYEGGLDHLIETVASSLEDGQVVSFKVVRVNRLELASDIF